MEKKKVNISYACPIKWDTMQSLDDKTKFCGSCKMKVRDFTKESSLNTEGIHCGRFRADQVESINRTFNFNPKQVFVVSLFSLLGMTAPLAAQNNTDTISSNSLSKEVKSDDIIITGLVQDSDTQEGIPFANVLIKGADGAVITGGSTDMDGKFSINVSREVLTIKGVTLQISVLGYRTTTLAAPKVTSDSLKLNIDVIPVESELLGMLIIEYHKPFDRNGTKTFDNEDIRESPYRQ